MTARGLEQATVPERIVECIVEGDSFPRSALDFVPVGCCVVCAGGEGDHSKKALEDPHEPPGLLQNLGVHHCRTNRLKNWKIF